MSQPPFAAFGALQTHLSNEQEGQLQQPQPSNVMATTQPRPQNQQQGQGVIVGERSAPVTPSEGPYTPQELPPHYTRALFVPVPATNTQPDVTSIIPEPIPIPLLGLPRNMQNTQASTAPGMAQVAASNHMQPPFHDPAALPANTPLQHYASVAFDFMPQDFGFRPVPAPAGNHVPMHPSVQLLSPTSGAPPHLDMDESKDRNPNGEPKRKRVRMVPPQDSGKESRDAIRAPTAWASNVNGFPATLLDQLISPETNSGNDPMDPAPELPDQDLDEADERPYSIKDMTDALLERQLDLQNDKDNTPVHSRTGNGPSRQTPRGEDVPTRATRGDRVRGRRRGPRKAAEPTGDVKYRLSMASEAYMAQQLDEAIEWVEDAIRINAEIFRAWSMLASFLEQKGDHKGRFTAKMYACHLEPKNIEGWIDCADIGFELCETFPDDAPEILDNITLCYSNALRADVENRPARHGRAAVAAEKGQPVSAAKDYLFLVERSPGDVHALRALAEMSLLLADTGKAPHENRPQTAIEKYRRCIAHFQTNGMDDPLFQFEWQDIKIFVELLEYDEQFKDAVYELASLARWLLGRSDEKFWDEHLEDDREWDVDDTRRLEIRDFEAGKYPLSSYGEALPLDLRTKLAVYRLKLGDTDEARHHLTFLDPDGPDAEHLISEEPQLLLEAASVLYEAKQCAEALRYYELLLQFPDLLDSVSLVAAGRCYLDVADNRQAEECFTAAIETDESDAEACIDARYELAKMYEAVKEDREAYILVNEALELERVRDEAKKRVEQQLGNEQDESQREDQEGGESLGNTESAVEYNDDGTRKDGETVKEGPKAKAAKKKKLKLPKTRVPKSKWDKKPGLPRRRPKVFAHREEVEKEQKQRSKELARAWTVVHRCHQEPQTDKPSEAFVAAAKELVDDFKSYKSFYSWDKYLVHLGFDQEEQVVSANSSLLEMRNRLSHHINPQTPSEDRHVVERTAVSYRNVPFQEWLDLIMEYAIGLAHLGDYQESYKVCDYARDAGVFANSKQDIFLINVTLAACALRANDEETCIAAARHMMRENQAESDPFRMYAALSRLCRSPASWYASGPVQKYFLRQIKLMDRALTAGAGEDSGDEDGPNAVGVQKAYTSKELDISLLMLYAHILFISNSHTYALNYLMRAYSIDPNNPMIILSVSQSYIQYALKRQSENRSYLLIQGFSFLRKYYEIKAASPHAAVRQEAHYNYARSYHAVGTLNIAAEYYQRALEDRPDDDEAHDGGGIMGKQDLTLEAAYNLQQICLAGGDMDGVRRIANKYLVI